MSGVTMSINLPSPESRGSAPTVSAKTSSATAALSPAYRPVTRRIRRIREPRLMTDVRVAADSSQSLQNADTFTGASMQDADFLLRYGEAIDGGRCALAGLPAWRTDGRNKNPL